MKCIKPVSIRMYFFFCLLILEFPNGIPLESVIICVFHMFEQSEGKVRQETDMH